MVLKEFKGVRQREDEGYRRWFVSTYFDVILWFDRPEGEITGFQVCYERNTTMERAYSSYGREKGHRFVQERKELHGFAGMGTAVLHGDAGAVAPVVLERLVKEKGELPQIYLDLILKEIAEYNARRG